MKKLVCAALACVFLLTACGKTDSDVTSETPAATSAIETAVAEVSETTQATTTTAETTETTTETTEATTKPTTTEKQTETTTEPPPQTTATAKPTETTTEKQTEKEEKVEMPEIVFIDLANSISTENIVYGYFINNKGEIRYYEYLDERYEAYTLPPNENEWGINYMERFRKWEFSYNLIDEMYDTIIETSVDTGERVEISNLKEMYNTLLSIDSSSKIEYEDWSMEDIETMAKHRYGVRFTSDNKIEKVFIRGGSEIYFYRDDDISNPLATKISLIFPKYSTSYIPQILQTEDNKEDE